VTRSSKQNPVERPNLERSLAILAVSALAASDTEAFAAAATELLSAALDTPVTIVRDESDQLAVELGAAGHELEPAEHQFVEDALAVINASDERQRRDAARHTRDSRPTDDALEYRKLLEELPFITYIDLPDEDILTGYLSPQIEEILGYTPEALSGPGNSFFDIVRPEDRERMITHARSALKGHAGELEYRVRAADGRTVWLKDRAVPQLDADGAVTSVRGFMLDITREKTIAEAAAVSDERYRSLVETVPAIVYVDNPNDIASSVYLSPRFEEWLGHKVATILETPTYYVENVIHPDDRDAVVASLARSSAGERVGIEYRCVATDGRVVWVYDDSVPMLGADGVVTEVRGFLVDITDRKLLDAERIEAEERYRALVEEMPGIVYVDAPDTAPATIYISPHVEEMVGYTPSEIVADPELWIGTVVHPDDRDLVAAATVQAAKGIPSQSEHRCVARDGRIVWVHAESIPQLDPQGNVVAVRGYIWDITERKHLEAQRSEAEERYRALVENLPGVVYLNAPDDAASAIYVSPQVESILGYSEDEWLRTPEFFARRVVHPDDRESVLDRITKANNGERSRSEYRCVAKDGRVVWFYDDSTPVHDERGNVIASHGFMLDITDRKVAEEDRYEADARFRALVEEVPGVVYVDAANETGSAIYMSPQVESLLGYSLDDWFSTPDFFVEMVLHPDDRKRMLVEIAEDNAGVRGKSEYRCVAKDGRIVWIYDESVPQFDERGAIVATRGFMLDITDRKIAEHEVEKRDDQLRQAQRMEAVGRLAGGVAHDFNNLLTVIKGHVDLLAGAEGLSDLAREELASVATAAERAAGLTRQLLAFSRQQVLQPAVLHLGGVVSDLTAMLRRLLVERIGLSVDSEPELWSVLVDRSQVEQVVVNLVVNARDAMPEGGTISVVTRNVVVDDGDHNGAAPGDYVALSVSDTGVGVDPEVRKQMFEPFFTTKDIGEGTGLGLATVHGIVEQSGGLISVESVPDEGTTVRVLFPRVDAVVESTPLAPAPPAKADGESILLVEDDPDVRALVRLALENAGYSVIEAPDPGEAILVASQVTTEIDMVLTDLVMPGMNGRELAESLVTARPKMKVLLMSGYTDDEVVRHGVSGTSAFIQKPFLPTELVAKVHAVLQGTSR
jgi:two-component system, cell cycle sensor histidine kinase and response regulator CckA